MQKTDIDREIRRFIAEHFLVGRAEELRDDGSLIGNVIDSIGILDLIVFLQSHFGFVVEDEEMIPSNLDSVKSLVAFVERKLPKS